MDNSKKELLKLEKLLPAYLYFSTSDSLLEDTIDNIKSLLEGKVNLDTDFKIFSGMEEIDEEEFTGYINTPSLFSSKKIAVIKYIEKVPVSLQKKVADLILMGRSENANIILIIIF